MSYDFSAFCGNVIQLTAKETFPPKLPVFAGCWAGDRAVPTPLAGTRGNPTPSGARPPASRHGVGKEQGCWGCARTRGAQGTKGSKKQSEASPSSAPSRPQLRRLRPLAKVKATPGRGAGVGRAGSAPASQIPPGRRQSTGMDGALAPTPGLGPTAALAPSAQGRAQPPSGLGTQFWHYGGTCWAPACCPQGGGTRRPLSGYPAEFGRRGAPGLPPCVQPSCSPGWGPAWPQGPRGQESPGGLRQPPSHRPPSFPASGGPGRGAPFQALLR